MSSVDIIKQWFHKWETGDYLNLPVSENFRHTSPYGIIKGKKEYINLVKANEDKFLGHRFEIHDGLYEKNKACVRYTAVKDNFSLDVSEWYYLGEDQIEEIIAYYNIEGEISEERKISMP